MKTPFVDGGGKPGEIANDFLDHPHGAPLRTEILSGASSRSLQRPLALRRCLFQNAKTLATGKNVKRRGGDENEAGVR
ncbi:MAG: hypothetical protein KatS3mg105_3817 [Gemmatales bacterium]|nr:MAG: hypothetical protein KatS3mg105_3817 [Gemmatales bacterium]